MLARGPVTVSALSAPLGVTVTAVGPALARAREGRLAAPKSAAGPRYCRLRPDGLRELERWAQQCRDEWEARFDGSARCSTTRTLLTRGA
jgi:hypothetical protein